jgi:hypothetical protein
LGIRDSIYGVVDSIIRGKKKKELEKKRGELARQRCFTDKENQLIKGKKETREG